MRKYTGIILALVMCLTLLAACVSENEAVDPGFDTVVEDIEAVVSTDGMAKMDSEYIENMFKLTTDDYEQCLVMSTNVGTTIDEFGIFKGTDSAQAESLHAAVNDYLQLRLDAWMPEYLPEQFPKLQNAKVWAEGNYVFYAILSEDTKTAASEAFTGCFAA